MNDELKACPFCGKQHEWEDVIDVHWGKHKSASCQRFVLLQAYTDAEQEKLTAFFNGRPIEDSLRAENERLKQELIDFQNILHKAEDGLADAKKHLEDATNEIANLKDIRQDPYDMIYFYKRKADDANRELAEIKEGLVDPQTVHTNIMLGRIILPNYYIRTTDTHGEYAQLKAELEKLRKHARWTPVTEKLPKPFVRIYGLTTYDRVIEVRFCKNYWQVCENGSVLPIGLITHYKTVESLLQGVNDE